MARWGERVERSSGAAPPLGSGADPEQNGSLDGSPLGIALKTAGDDARVIELAGELDLSTIPKLETCLRKALESRTALILDLRALTFIDSSGIALLIKAHQASAADGTLRTIISRESQVERVLGIAGVDRVLEISFDLEEARAALASHASQPRGTKRAAKRAA